MDTHYGQMSSNPIILKTCTLDIHTAVDPGFTLWVPDVLKLYNLEYMYPGYTYFCRPCIHIMGPRCLLITYLKHAPWIHILL